MKLFAVQFERYMLVLAEDEDQATEIASACSADISDAFEIRPSEAKQYAHLIYDKREIPIPLDEMLQQMAKGGQA